MSKLFEKFKKLNNIDKALIMITVIIMILLVSNLIISVRDISQFNLIKSSGNDRWFQVEERIITYEHKINQLEELIKNLK